MKWFGDIFIAQAERVPRINAQNAATEQLYYSVGTDCHHVRIAKD